jgi:hypothetical protein
MEGYGVQDGVVGLMVRMTGEGRIVRKESREAVVFDVESYLGIIGKGKGFIDWCSKWK